jgi:2-methylcitrate dehydratase
MYIVAVALQDGAWHHVRSYAPERANRPDTVALWKRIRTIEDPKWTERYHSEDPAVKAFGGRIVITLKGGRIIEGERAVANAHTLGATPWRRADYIRKFTTLTEGIVEPAEAERFLRTVQRLPELAAGELSGLNVAIPSAALERGPTGLFG